MEATTRHVGAVRIFSPSGRIDQANVDQFQRALEPYLDECSAQGSPLLLDFSAIDYISSVGLQVLILASKRVKAQAGRMAIAALTPVVAEIFQISRFNLVVRVLNGIDDAVADLTK